MTPTSPPKPTGVGGLLVTALIIVLLAGALLVRLVNVDQLQFNADNSPSTTSGDLDQKADSAVSGMPSSDAPGSSGLPRQGHTAPDFTLENLDGIPTVLSDLRGKVVLINFWATWCAPCELEMPAIEAIYSARQERDFAVLAVAVDDSAENVRRFVEEYDLSFQPLLDDGTIARDYLVFGLPTSFFVGPDGRITDVHTGLLTEDKIEEYLARAVSQDG